MFGLNTCIYLYHVLVCIELYFSRYVSNIKRLFHSHPCTSFCHKLMVFKKSQWWMFLECAHLSYQPPKSQQHLHGEMTKWQVKHIKNFVIPIHGTIILGCFQASLNNGKACLDPQTWGAPTHTWIPWRQWFRHPTRNECMGWFNQIQTPGSKKFLGPC